MIRLTTLMLILMPMFAVQIGCDEPETEDASNLGTLELKGDWDGDLTPSAHFDWAIFNCPFSMPPMDSGDEVIADGEVHVVIEDLEPGTYCLLAYIDMNPDDGLMWVDGLDAAAYPEAGAVSIEVIIEKGQTTTLNLEFTVSPDSV